MARVRLLVPTGTRRRIEHQLWRGWAAGVIVVATLSFTGWVLYNHLLYPPVPIEARRLEVSYLPPPPSDTGGALPVAQERLDTIRRMADCGASDVDVRVRALTDSFPHWPDDMLAAAACRQIRAYMTKEQLRAALGEPTRIMPVRTMFRPAETWYYGNRMSVILWGGLVRSWQ